MNYLDEVPDHLVVEITTLESIEDLRYMRARYNGARNVWVRLAIDERIQNIKCKAVNR